MNQLLSTKPPVMPALVAAAGERASMRFLEFFAANIRNPHTRRAYYRAAEEFLAWCARRRLSMVGAARDPLRRQLVSERRERQSRGIPASLPQDGAGRRARSS